MFMVCVEKYINVDILKNCVENATTVAMRM